jgi:hypothetical protein
LEAVRAFDNTIWAAGLVASKILAESRSFTVLTIRNLKLTFLANKKWTGRNKRRTDRKI